MKQPMTLVKLFLLMLTLSVQAGCSAEATAKKVDPPLLNDGDEGDSDDAIVTDPPADKFEGVYQTKTHTETKFSCDGEEDTAWQTFDFFSLETFWDPTPLLETPEGTDLWLSECTSKSECIGQVVNYFFPEKKDGVWSGATNIQASNTALEEGLCGVLFVERQAKLKGTTIEITTTTYSDEVKPLGNGICPGVDGADKDADDYYKAYKGKVACSRLEKLVGKRVGDLPGN